MTQRNKRTLVVGDIHGNYKALLQVLERSSYNPKEDMLIFLGDYCDGGSETREVIDCLIKLDKEATHKPVFLLGNHDVWLQKYLELGVELLIWIKNGGQTTIDSYKHTSFETKFKHLKFLEKCLNFYFKDDKFYVHGGFRNIEDPIKNQSDQDYLWDRTLWELACKSPKNTKFTEFDEIFIGHTTTEILNTTHPVNRCNVWNLDTGAGWRGKLTAMCVETKEYWQSDLTQELYPERKY